MRYDDASQTGSPADHTAPVARADVDTLAPGSYGPASGNAITGTGTTTGGAGADSVSDGPGAIVELHGAGGAGTETAGAFQAAGQYGVLSMDAQGNYNYVRNAGTPDGVQDVFGYTLADRDGGTSATTLTIDIGQVATAAAAAAQQGLVNLPAGVELSDIHVNGRDLVIDMPDGTQMVIPGGAVFVPQLVIGDVEVPPTNLAALLIDAEPKPAAGELQSSGGNFAADVPPLDPGVPLGDLIPPTELAFTPPEFRDINQFEDTEPTVVIVTPDDPAGAVNADASVSEAGLPARTIDGSAEPQGSNAASDSEMTTGTIVFEATDGLKSITIDGLGAGQDPVTITADSVGTVIHGAQGDLTITSVNLASGQIGYTYLLTDNTNPGGDGITDPFTVVVTDSDNDTATATLTVHIQDDVPDARNDTDSLDQDGIHASGNVVSGLGTTNTAAGQDVPGADGINGETNDSIDGVTGIHAGTSGSFTTVPQDGSGVLVHGAFGDLVIHDDGSYTYTLTGNQRAGGTEVFTYQLTDGDGDTDTATLTITVPPNSVPEATNSSVLVDDDGLPLGNHDSALGDDTQNPDPDSNESTASGTLTANFGTDGPGTFDLAAMNDVEASIGQETVRYTWDDATDTLTATIITSIDPTRVQTDLFTVHLDPNGQYTVTLEQNVLQNDDGTNTENNAEAVLTFTAHDNNGDSDSDNTLTISFDDDIPVAITPPPPTEGHPQVPVLGGLVDEDDLSIRNGDSVNGNHDHADGDDDPVDASGDSDPTTTGGAAGSLYALFDPGADRPLSFTLDPNTSGLPALTSNGHQVLYNVSGNVLTAVADLDDDGQIDSGETTVFTLTVNTDGSWSFDLNGALDHHSAGTEDNLNLDLGSIVIASDADGDDVHAAPGAFVITVDDDLPTAVVPPIDPEHPNAPPPPLVTGLVDEDDLSTANGDNSNGNHDAANGDDDPVDASGDSDPTTTGGGAGSLAALFNAGADQPLTYTLNPDTSGLPALTSNGHEVLYSVTGGVLTAVADLDNDGQIDSGETTVFTLTVNEDGSWSFNLQDQLDHSEPGIEDNLLLDFSSIVTATDADGDPATAAPGAFVINVDDDMPKPFLDSQGNELCPDDTVATNQPGTDVTGIDLNLPPVGADDPGKLTFGVANNTLVVDNEGHPIMSDGHNLYYFVNESDPTILEARTTADGEPVFTIDLNPDTGTYDFHLIGDISSQVQVSIPITSSIGGGNVDAKGIDVPNTPFDLILSTSSGDTVNTNAGFIGITGAQALEANDVVRIDFLQNVFSTGSGQTEQLNFGEYYSVSSFREDVGGLNSQQFASFTVTAFNVNEAAGSNPSDPADGDNVFYGDTNDSIATDTSINIYDDNGALVTAAHYADFGIEVTEVSDGVWQVVHLPQDFDYEIVSSSTFEAVQVHALGEGETDTFKLGAIDMTRVEQVDVDFTVPITLTDADGDPVNCDITVHLTPGVAAAVATATLDDDGLANANPLGTADINANANDDNAGQPGDTEALFVGQLTATGGSGDLDFRLIAPGGTVTIGQETVTISGTDSLLTATIATSPDGDRVGDALFTVSLNTDTGEYTVTLLENVLQNPAGNDEDGVEHSIGIQFAADDDAGGSSTGTLKIVFNDDVPTAVDDTDSIQLGAAAASGNVLTGVIVDSVAAPADANSTDGAADTIGADGSGHVTQVSYTDPQNSDPNTNTITVTVPDGGFATIDGDNGQLKIYSNGDYVYTRADGSPGDGSDTFTYTISDADGDTAHADLHITIEDAPVTVDIPGAGASTTVYENALGTDPQGTSEAQIAGGNGDPHEVTSGTIAFTAADGLGSISIDGTPVTFGSGATFPQTVSDDATGKLEITGVTFNEATGVGSIAYTYTLEDNTLGSQATNGGNTTVSFDVDIVDSDGDHSPDGNLVITIVDDAPIATDDGVIAVPEDGHVDIAAFTNDFFGADGVDTDNNPAVKVTFTDAAKGTVTYDPATGHFGYTADPGASGSDSFTYTITDGDGDSDTATVTLTIAADSVPDIKTPTNVSVDEDGLPGHNVDNGQPGEVDHGGQDSATGTVTVDFGGDRPGDTQADWLDAIHFTDPTALNGQLTQNGVPVVFSLDATTGDLIGKVGTTPVVTISFTAAAAGSGGNVNYTYTVNLDGPVDQAGNSTEDSISLNGITFNVTDSDSDSDTPDASFNVTIYDDVPEVAVSGATTVVEGETATGTWTHANGVDLPASTVVTIGANTYALDTDIDTGKGTLRVGSDGSWTFHSVNNLDQDSAQSISFTVKTTDADHDVASDVQTISITDGAPPQGGGSITLEVDDEALSDGTNAASTAEVDADTLSFTAGSDDLTGFAFSTNLSSLGGGLTWTRVSATEIQGWDGAVGTGTKVVTLTLTAPSSIAAGDTDTVTVTATLNNNYDSHPGINVDDLQNLGSVTVVATDQDSGNVTGTVNVGVSDDVPLNFTPDVAQAENSGSDIVSGKLDSDDSIVDNAGADGIKSLTWNVAAPGTTLLDTDGNPITVSGETVKLYVEADGSLTATTDHSQASATVFTATLDPATSSYEIDFDRPLDNGSTSASDFSAVAAGNTPWKGVDPDLVNGSPLDIEDSGDPNPDSTDILITGFNASTSAALTINTDADDIGTGTGQKLSANETLRIDLVQDLGRDPGDDERDAGGYTYDDHVGQKVFSFTMVDPQSGNDTTVLLKAYNVTDTNPLSQSNVGDSSINAAVEIDPNSIVVTLNGVTLTEGTDYFVHDAGGPNDGVYVESIPKGAVIQFEAIGGATFEAVTITNGVGDENPDHPGTFFTGADFAVGGFTYGQNDPGDPVEFVLPVKLTDADNDTSSGIIHVTVNPVGSSASTTAAIDSSLHTASLAPDSLETAFLSANDNQLQRSFNTGTDGALIGAIAAVGLTSGAENTGNAFDSNVLDSDTHSQTITTSSLASASQPAVHDEVQSQVLDTSAPQDGSTPTDSPVGTAGDTAAPDTGLVTGNPQDSAPTELLQGTDAPAHDSAGSSTPLTAAAVTMPSAEQLLAASGGNPATNPQNATVEGHGAAQHNQVVAQVLADALHGGGHGGHNIDALINALPGGQGGHGQSALEALASHGDASVSNGDIGHLAGLAAAHTMPFMDQMAMHQDAAPVHG